jgi:hypothetical protein
VGRVNAVRRAGVRRWLAVAGGVLVLCLLPSVVGWWPTASASADPGVLRQKILASANQPYQGYVDSKGDVTLPDLPQLGDVTKLFGGTTSMRVWYRSTRAWRVAVVEPTGERDIYQTADGTYRWDFSRNQVTAVLGDLPVRLPWAADVVPPELGRRLLGTAGSTERVRAIGSRRIAGVAAAGLRVTPGDPDSTIASVDIWADPKTGLPLRVEVSQPSGVVFTSRFLELTQKAPDEEVVTPRVADSSTFTVTRQPDVASAISSTVRVVLPNALAGRQRVAVQGVPGIAAYGDGFSRFVVFPLPGRVGADALFRLLGAGATLMQTLPEGAEGAALRTAVLTIVIVRTVPGPRRRTYLLAGFVTPDLLTRATADLITGAR